MKQVVSEGPASVIFWDGYAKWYELWMEHNHYHDSIINILTANTTSGWKVLDIGAGNGVLSLPLCSIGCEVTALEPSQGMRDLLQEQAFLRGTHGLTVDERRWEDVQTEDRQHSYDLVMACNSLHLTNGGFNSALDKVFRTRSQNIFIITEHTPETRVRTMHPGYTLLFSKSFETDDSFCYHHLAEALEHQSFRTGSPFGQHEDCALQANLCYQDGHLVLPSTARVGMYWWQRHDDFIAQHFQGKGLHYGLVESAC